VVGKAEITIHFSIAPAGCGKSQNHPFLRRAIELLCNVARLYLVRHGKAASTWDDRDPDPGLTVAGHEQAEARAVELADVGPLPIVTSPASPHPRNRRTS
jgi:Histidine phosphatase superfamily (branch 1)